MDNHHFKVRISDVHLIQAWVFFPVHCRQIDYIFCFVLFLAEVAIIDVCCDTTQWWTLQLLVQRRLLDYPGSAFSQILESDGKFAIRRPKAIK